MYRQFGSRFVKPQFFFLCIAIPVVGILVFLTPPFNVADENAHFFRSYGISLGDIAATPNEKLCGSEIPASVLATSGEMTNGIAFNPAGKISRDKILGEFSRPLNPSELTFASYPNTAPYSPIPYFPQIVGILIGRLLEAPPIALLYVARFLNAGATLLILFIAIRGTPIIGWAMAAAHLTPMALFQIGSTSADGMTFALTALVLSFGLRLIYGTLLIKSDKMAIALGALASLMTLAKFAYFPMLAVFFLAPSQNLASSRKTYWKRLAFLIMPSIILQSMWVFYIKDSVVATRQDIVVNTNEQVRFVLAHPIHFIKAVWVSWDATFRFYIESYYGFLGWLDTKLPEFTLWAAAVGFFLTCFIPNIPSFKLDWKKRLAFLAVLLTTNFSIFFFLYLYWNPVGANQVEGIQGRYFIPLSAMLALVISLHLLMHRVLRGMTIFLVYGIFVYSSYMTVASVYSRYFAG
jgi:uncharacterized membrane protein